MKKASNKWYFTKETNAKGLCYIYAYQTQWDPVAKKSKRSARKYVGRLAADSVVNITAKFRTEFPQYAQGTFYCKRPIASWTGAAAVKKLWRLSQPRSLQDDHSVPPHQLGLLLLRVA